MNETQQVNAALTNQPKTIQIDGKTVPIYSHSPRRMVLIDGITDQLIELSQQLYHPTETHKTLDSLSEDEKNRINTILSQFTIEELSEMVLQYSSDQIRTFENQRFSQYAALGVNALFHIINVDIKNPEFTEDWIWDHIPIQGEGSLGEQVINLYNEQKSPIPFLQALAGARSLA